MDFENKITTYKASMTISNVCNVGASLQTESKVCKKTSWNQKYFTIISIANLWNTHLNQNGDWMEERIDNFQNWNVYVDIARVERLRLAIC